MQSLQLGEIFLKMECLYCGDESTEKLCPNCFFLLEFREKQREKEIQKISEQDERLEEDKKAILPPRIRNYCKQLVKEIDYKATLTEECLPLITDKINKILKEAIERAREEHKSKHYQNGYWIKKRHI